MADMNLRKNLEYMSETKKLRAHQNGLEKNTSNLLNNLNNIFQHDDLKLFLIAMKEQTQREKIKFCNDIQEIRKSFDTLGKKSCILDLDLDHLRDFLFDITDNITSLKDANQERIENLTEQEKLAMVDLESLEKRLYDFMKVNLTNVNVRKPLVRLKPTSSHFQALIPKKLNAEADAFDRFLLRTGGHMGGWDEEDHLIFIRQRAKHRGHRLADALNAVLPDIPVEIILQHESWYNQYESLKSLQRNAIKSWRDSRKILTSTTTETQQIEAKPERISNPLDTQEKRQKILEWKMRKRDQQRVEQEAKKTERLRQTESVNSRSRKEQERQRLEEYKRKKRMEEEAERARREKLVEGDHVMNSKLLLMFRERDRVTVASSLQRIEQQRQEKAEKSARKRNNKVVAERDPSRLLRPTEGWRNRVKHNESSSGMQPDLVHPAKFPTGERWQHETKHGSFNLQESRSTQD